MTDTTAPRAIIIGGSLGGLFTALTLRAIGWRVDVFERSPHALDSRGGGIVLQPDVLHAFHFAGLRHPGALGVASGDRIFLDRDGKVVQRGYQPQTQTSWNMLHSLMRQALPDTQVHAGATLLRFEQAGGQVRAYFAGGRVETGDLLVGADGARSTVRQQLLPGVAPDYAGYVAWRGLAPEPALGAADRALLGGVFAFQQGPDHMFLEYLVPGEDRSLAPGARRWNWVWHRKLAQERLAGVMTAVDGRQHAFSLPPGALRPEHAAALREDAARNLAPQFSRLVGLTAEPFVQAILDLDSPRMASGRVVLVGDAASVPRPHTAGGAAKAAANALFLAQALQRTELPVEARLREWETLQLRAGRLMLDAGRRMGDRIIGVAPGADASR